MNLRQLIREELEQNYPSYIPDRYKSDVDKLFKGVEDKFIYNVDLNDIKFMLSHAIEKACEDLITDIGAKYSDIVKNFSKDSYSYVYSLFNWDLPNKFMSLKKHKRILEDKFKNDGGMRKNQVYEMISEFIDSWLRVKNALDEVKQYVQKGRRSTKPVEEQPYRAPIASVKKSTFSLVEEILRKTIESSRKELYDTTYRWLNAIAQKFLIEREKKQTRGLTYGNHDWYESVHEFISRNKILVPPGLSSCFTDSSHEKISSYYWPKDILLDKEKFDAYVNSVVEETIKQFLAKNISKISTIVDAKISAGNELSEWKQLEGSFRSGAFSGVIKFSFSDNTSFQVWNGIVYGYSARGASFVRFPTTFHDIYFKNGAFSKLLSEEDMNIQWAVEE